MKYLQLVSLSAVVCFGMFGCMHKLEVGDITIKRVSMIDLPAPNYVGKKIGMAEEKFCSTDKNPFAKIGFVNELVSQAMSKSDATYIENAIFKPVPFSFAQELSIHDNYTFPYCWTLIGNLMK